MTKTLLDKMFLKPEYSVAIRHLPKELETELQPTQTADATLRSTYNFILAFYSQSLELKEEAAKLKDALLPNGLLWIAYPKNKVLETDLNRDMLHSMMKEYGLDGVSLVSLNPTWSAMRFKVI